MHRRTGAASEPERLFRQFPLPPGAVRLTTAPRAYGGELGYRLGDWDPVDHHRYWRLRMPFAAAVAFVSSHRPASARTVANRPAFRRPAATRELEWSFPAIPHLIATRVLDVTLLKLSRHTTAIRVDAKEIWSARPRSERLPAGVRSVTIHEPRWFKKPASTRRLSGPAMLAFVRWIDGLPVFTMRDSAACSFGPPIGGPRELLAFRAANGRLLAWAWIEPSSRCTPVRFYVHGHQQPPLEFSVMQTRQLGAS